MVKARLVYALVAAGFAAFIIYLYQANPVYYFGIIIPFAVVYWWNVLFGPSKEEADVRMLAPGVLWREISKEVTGEDLGLDPYDFDMRNIEFDYNKNGECHFVDNQGIETLHIWADGRIRELKEGEGRIYAYQLGQRSRQDSKDFTVKPQQIAVEKALQTLAKNYNVTEGQIAQFLTNVKKETQGVDENG